MNAARQRAILLSGCGASTYQLIRNLVSPAKPSDKSFSELTKISQDHQHPLPSATAQCFSFHSCSQCQRESISAFVTELQKLSEHCNFGESLPKILCNWLVCGINNQGLQCDLLTEAPLLTFNKVIGLAQAMEAAEHNGKSSRNTCHIDTTTNGEWISSHRCNSVVLSMQGLAPTGNMSLYEQRVTTAGERDTSPRFAVADPSLLDINFPREQQSYVEVQSNVLCIQRTSRRACLLSVHSTRPKGKSTPGNAQG